MGTHLALGWLSWIRSRLAPETYTRRWDKPKDILSKFVMIILVKGTGKEKEGTKK